MSCTPGVVTLAVPDPTAATRKLAVGTPATAVPFVVRMNWWSPALTTASPVDPAAVITSTKRPCRFCRPAEVIPTVPAARLFSAGCVRLEDAQRLARWLYGKPLTTHSGNPEQKIPLATPVPVFITYLTIGVENGRLAYRQDVYGRDAARLAALR